MAKAICIKQFWDGKGCHMYFPGEKDQFTNRPYDIDPDSPMAKHFEFPDSHPVPGSSKQVEEKREPIVKQMAEAKPSVVEEKRGPTVVGDVDPAPVMPIRDKNGKFLKKKK